MADPTLNVVVKANTSQADSALKSVETRGNNASNVIAAGFMKAQIALGVITGVARGLARGIQDVVNASNEQVAAEAKLRGALEATGQASAANVAMLSQQASTMQQNLLINDEVTMSLMGQAAALTNLSADKLPKVIQAAAQLSEMTGKSLEASMTSVTKVINGASDKVKGLATDFGGLNTEDARLIALLGATNKGMEMIEARASTTAGASARLQMTWGDLKEEAGRLITDNRYLADVINLVNDTVVKLMGQVQEWLKNNPKLAAQLRGDLALGVLTAVQVIDHLATGLFQVGYGFAYATEAMKVYNYWLTGNTAEMERAQAAMGNYATMLQSLNTGYADRQQAYGDLRTQIRNQQMADMNWQGPRQGSALKSASAAGNTISSAVYVVDKSLAETTKVASDKTISTISATAEKHLAALGQASDNTARAYDATQSTNQILQDVSKVNSSLFERALSYLDRLNSWVAGPYIGEIGLIQAHTRDTVLLLGEIARSLNPDVNLSRYVVGYMSNGMGNTTPWSVADALVG